MKDASELIAGHHRFRRKVAGQARAGIEPVEPGQVDVDPDDPGEIRVPQDPLAERGGGVGDQFDGDRRAIGSIHPTDDTRDSVSP